MENKEMDNKSITLGDLFRIVKKNIILMCVIIALAIIAGLIYVLEIVTPTYRSKADVNVAVASATSQDAVSSIDTLRITTTVAYIAKSKVTRLEAAKNILGASASEAEINSLAAKIGSGLSTSGSDESYIVSIYVVNADKSKAKEYCQAVATAIVDLFATNEAFEKYDATLYNINPASNAVYYAPNKMLYMIVFTGLGLVAACVVVFLKEFVSTKFKTRDEIEYVTGVPSIGLFPDKKEAKNIDGVSFVDGSVHSFEPYNKLFTNIKFANVDNPYKAIMITSTVEDELKTTVILNLAYCMANNNAKVCVVDLDLRIPIVHKTCNVLKEHGVSEYVAGTDTIDTIIKSTSYNIDVITAGKKIDNPFLILDSLKLKELIEELKNRYDYVLVDTPPMAVCADSKTISKMVDGVLYNVTINQVNKKLFKECSASLKAVGANIIGFNITKLPVGKLDRDYYYDYYYSSYYTKNNDNTNSTDEAKEEEQK